MGYNNRYNKRRKRRNGPNFGSLASGRSAGRLPGLLAVLVLSIGLGLGAYALADHNLNKKEPAPKPTTEITKAPEATKQPEITPVPTQAVSEPEKNEVYPDGVLADFVDTRTRVKAKGIYVNTAFLGRRAGSTTYPTIEELTELLDTTELNAMVIDIKDDYGNILYDTKNPLVIEINGTAKYIGNLPEFVSKLKNHGIYCIARIVTFKDSVMTKAKPDMAVKNPNGGTFVDGDGERWLNPYNPQVREYLINIAKEAAEAGFDEIQFDYLRMSSSLQMDSADFGNIPEGMTKSDAVIEFVKYACEQLKPIGVFVSGDVFATIINSVADGARIGQNYVELSRYLDYICPMAYPSHYNFKYGGIPYPDTQPFDLILMEMRSSVKKLSVIGEGEHRAEVRPWLQDFTASWLGAGRYLVYGKQELRAQISAVYSAGYSEWLLWNAVMNYSKDGLLPDKDF